MHTEKSAFQPERIQETHTTTRIPLTTPRSSTYPMKVEFYNRSLLTASSSIQKAPPTPEC